MEKYIAISFKAQPHQSEMIAALLMDAGFEGVEEKENETVSFIPETLYDEALVKSVFQNFGIAFTTKSIEQQNWNAQWEQSFAPVQVDDFAAIRAAFHQPIAGVKHDIVITPKMSFGTGHHATTYLVIKEMAGLDFANKSVIDFGTGTAVLAILAEKLGAKEVLAIDNDEWSITNSNENIESNNCSRINVELANEMTQNKKADIILANINLNVIIANVDKIKKSAYPHTQIIFSGIMVPDEKQILEVLINNEFHIQKTVHKNNWIAILATLS